MNLQDIIDIKNGKKPRYKRIGNCLRCGACCIEEECDYLKWDNNIAVCSVFDKPERRHYCKDWPEAPPIIYKTCGYRFYDVIDKNEIMPGDRL